MSHKELFKGKHFQAEVILWGVRWYGRFALSYRDLALMAKERGLSVAHTTFMNWVHEYAPMLEKKLKVHLRKSNDSYRIDETYIKIKGRWQYLYRAVDSTSQTLDWMLSRHRNSAAARRFFKKILGNKHCQKPRVISVDKAKAYPPAFSNCQNAGEIPEKTTLRQQKYLNNIQEQDHRFIKRRVRHSQWFQSLDTARRTLAAYEAMHRIRKGQVKHLARNDIRAKVAFIHSLFGLAA